LAKEKYAKIADRLIGKLKVLETAKDEATVAKLACEQVFDKMQHLLQQASENAIEVEGRQYVPLSDSTARQQVTAQYKLVKRAAEMASQKEEVAGMGLERVIAKFQTG
jgi:hypothetical protein